MAELIFMMLFGAMYMLPTILAYNKGHPQTLPIVVVNFFLGWTLLAWVLCLAWALMNSSKTQTQTQT